MASERVWRPSLAPDPSDPADPWNPFEPDLPIPRPGPGGGPPGAPG